MFSNNPPIICITFIINMVLSVQIVPKRQVLVSKKFRKNDTIVRVERFGDFKTIDAEITTYGRKPVA